MDLAAAVGAGKVLIVPGFLAESEARALWDCRRNGGGTLERQMQSSEAICRVRDALRELVGYGEKKHVLITLEDFDGVTSPCSGMLFLKWFMEQAPGLGHTFDMGNYAYSDEDAVAAYEMLKPYIVHVHCKDRGVEPLRTQGYDGYLAIEHFYAPDQMEYIRRSAEFLGKLI